MSDSYNFLPDLPDGYHWQVCRGEQDITGDYYAESEATEARIWTESADLVLCLTRTGDYGYWGADGPDHEGGLRKWQVQGQAPEGLMDWEQFETLSEIGHRLQLEPVEA